MEKYLVAVEFRYSDAPQYEGDYTSRNKEITIGVFVNFEDACESGNKLLEKLEAKFPLHVYPNGKGTARRERFGKNAGILGGKKNLITNLAYLKTPFEFYAKITTLKYEDIDSIIDEVTDSSKRYREYKLTED